MKPDGKDLALNIPFFVSYQRKGGGLSDQHYKTSITSTCTVQYIRQRSSRAETGGVEIAELD